MNGSKLLAISSVVVLLILLSLNYSEMHAAYTFGSALNKITVEPNFPLEEGTFEETRDSKDSLCFVTPNHNQYCYKKPRVFGEDTLVSTIVGDNRINGEMHLDPVDSGVHYFTMNGMTRIHGDTANIFFADKDYRIGNRDRTTYEITEDFEYSAVIEKFDTFITHCGNFDGTGVTIVQYLGVITLDGMDYFATWHAVGSSEKGVPCKYPELIHHSLNHNFGEF